MTIEVCFMFPQTKSLGELLLGGIIVDAKVHFYAKLL